jgi:endoglucanase
MKNIKIYITPVFIFFTVLMFSCEKESSVDPELTLAKEEVSFSTEGGNQNLAIKSNTTWTAASSESWCTVTPSSGEEGTVQLALAISPNNTNGPREAIITITAGSLSKEVKVLQTLEKFVLDKKQFSVANTASEIVVNIESSSTYTSTIQSNWISLKNVSSDNKTQTFSISENASIVTRTGKIIYKSGKLTDTLVVTQTGVNKWIEADAEGMGSTAKTLASKMFMGWNIGNTLEAPGSETAWGNPKITQALIDSVYKAGFNAIRLPCAWNSHLEDTVSYKISDLWLARVKEVVDYCYKNKMYVIINIHWDGGWLEEHPLYSKQTEVNKKQKALWEQIAVYFRNYDEHLLFAGTNEVHANYGDPTEENITVQLSFNQTFVDAVRSTGGKNAYRTLIAQAYNTNINQAVQYLKMPNDNVTDRLMAEVHYYDPWDFCGDANSSVYLWGKDYAQYGAISSWGQETYLDGQFAKMKANFVDKGYPVVLGEYGAMLRSSLTGSKLTNHRASRAYYLKYLTQQAKNNGLVPFVWDNGGTGDNTMGLFYRSNGIQFDNQSIKALIEGATAGTYPF